MKKYSFVLTIAFLIAALMCVFEYSQRQVDLDNQLQNIRESVSIQIDKIDFIENKVNSIESQVNNNEKYYDQKIKELEEATLAMTEFNSPEELHEEDPTDPFYTSLNQPRDIEYTIKRGDNPWKIARYVYSDGSRYTEILSYNGLDKNSMLHPGDVLKIKLDNQLQEDMYYFSESLKEYEEEAIPVIDLNDGKEMKPNEIPDLDTSGGGKNYTAEVDTSTYTLLGSWRITGYDPYCTHCCGKSDGVTASGRQVELNYSCGNNDLEFGTILYIEGYGYYRVDDRGGSSHNHIDVACSSHAECYKMTNNSVNVYKVLEP